VCIHCGRCVPFCPHDCLELMDVGAGGTEYNDAQEGAS
jgi:formate hydrogenlyase subunit 6/NADH:ubiquinone oxidoreductase subunit I